MKIVISLCALILCLVGAVGAEAQLRLDSPDFVFYVQHNPSSVTSFTCQNPSVLQSVLSAGDTNAVWDFTVASYTRNPATTELDSFMLPAGVPLADDSDFTTSNIVIQATKQNPTARYNFFSVRPDGAFNLGVIVDGQGGPKKLIGWNPPLQDAGSPMTYKTAWQSFSNMDGDTLQTGEFRTIDSRSVVDGWGTIKIPTQSFTEPALRVRTVTIETGGFNGEVRKVDTTIQYNFYTQFLSSATITMDTRNAIRSARYTVNLIPASVAGTSLATNALNLTITQNPASNSVTHVLYSMKEAGPARVELMDLLGHSVRILQNGRASAGQHAVEINPNTLANGSYFVRVESNDMSAMEKLVVAR